MKPLELNEAFIINTLREFNHLLITKGYKVTGLTFNGIMDDGDSVVYKNSKGKQVEISLLPSSLITKSIYITIDKDSENVIDARKLNVEGILKEGVTKDNIEKVLTELKKVVSSKL